MTPLRLAVLLSASLAAQGCLSSSVVLHVRPDGGGSAIISTHLYLAGLRAFDAMFAAQGTAPSRPPEIEEELPPPTEAALTQAFGTTVHLVSTRLVRAGDGGVRTTEIEFGDIRNVQLVFPPVFPPPGQSLAIGGVSERPLMTFALRSHDNGDRLLVVKLPNPVVSNQPDAPVTVFETGSQEERLMKLAISKMSLKLAVEIEPPLLRTNAPKQEGNSATILDLDLDRMINAMDEPRVRRMMSMGSFQEMLWQVGDLPGAMVPVDTEVYLEYESPAPQQPAPQAAPAPQAPPATEIYLAPLTRANGVLEIGTPVNVTNNPGYDNQPFFTPDGRGMLFTSVRGAGPQTDIYRYDIASHDVTRVTQTPESEYSPTVMLDGTRISVIRVEADGTQRLASIAPSGPKIQVDTILPDVKPVGYHAWADDHTLALFILGAPGAPATLQLADTRTGTARVLATDIGRSILRMPGSGPSHHISFVQRERASDQTKLIVKELDPASGAITTLTPAVEGAREADLAWTPDGTLLMAQDGVLYAWARGQSGWTAVASLSRLGVQGVTRLAVSPKGDVIAIVGLPPATR